MGVATKKEEKIKIQTMKTNKIQTFSFLLVCVSTLLIFAQCSTSKKYYANFKQAKKQIDTLVMLTPYVYVEFLKNKEVFKDYELEETLTAKISAASYSELEGKYRLVNFVLQPDFISESELSNLFSILDSSSKDSIVPTPLFIQNHIKNDTNRYFLLIYFKGYYNSHFEPYYQLKQSMASNTMSISINNNLYSSDMRLLIFDNQQNIVVYYDKDYSKKNDPRVINVIEKMTSDILMPIYYK